MATESATMASPALGRGAETSRFSRHWLVAALTLVGGAVRLWRLDHQSLWVDEVLTVRSSETSLSVLFSNPVDPNIPPLYYLLIHFILPFGEGEALLRFPSVIAGTLSIPIFYAVVHRWAGARAALISAVVLTLSPFHVWYSQEARPYALLVFLALASLWFFQHLLDRPDSKSLAAGFLFCAAGAFYTHTVALPFLGVLGLYVLLAAPRRDLARWAWLALILVLLLTPVLYRFAMLPANASANLHYQFRPEHLGYALWAFGTGFSLGPNLVELRTDGMASVGRNILVVSPVLAVMLTLLVVGMLHLWRADRRLFWILVAMLALPIGFAAIGGVLTVHPFNVRYAITAFPAFVALIGIGAAALPFSYARVGALGALLFMSVASLVNYYYDPRYQREDTRAAVGFLNSHANEGDLVVSSAAYMIVVIKHYDLRDDLTLVGYPRGGSIRPAAIDLEKTDLGARFVAPEEVAQELGAIVGTRLSVWVFLSRTFHSDPEGSILKYLDARMRRDTEFTAAGVRVLRYYTRPLRPGG
jgi:mannosyltransferase